MNLKQPDAAVDLMLKAYAYNPRSFANNQRLLEYYGERGDREKIVEFMRALAESGPVAPALNADLGALLLELGHRDEAFVEFVKARRAAEAAGDTEVAKRASDAIRENHLTPPEWLGTL